MTHAERQPTGHARPISTLAEHAPDRRDELWIEPGIEPRADPRTYRSFDRIETMGLEVPSQVTNALWIAVPGLALALYSVLLAVAFFP
ncbi:MAG: hypothetical protein AAGF44_00015 [Pseudomonadota bacterium]